MKQALLILCSGLLVGCTPHANQQQACCCSVEVPTEWHSCLSNGMQICPSTCFAWWEELNDPLLNWLIDRLSCQNPDLCLASQDCESYKEAWTNVSADLAKTYIELRSLQMKYGLIQKSISSQKDTLALTKSLLTAGFASSIDEGQAEEQVEMLIAQLPQIRIGIHRAIYHLSVLLAYSPGELFPILSPCGPLPCIPCIKPIGTPCEIVQRRPDVRKARCQSPCEYQKAVLSALEEVENALSSFHYEVERTQQLGNALRLSQASYNKTLELYQKGLKNYLDVQTVHRSLLANEEALLDSRTAQVLNYIALYKALGGGW